MGVTDFSFIRDAGYRRDVEDAYHAIGTVDGGWEFMRTFEPQMGFMLSTDPMLSQIYGVMNMEHHSGASLAGVMRAMEMIAKKGFAEFRKLYE